MSDNLFKCDYCNKIFKSKFNSLRHINTCKIHKKIEIDNYKMSEENEKQKMFSENIMLKEELKKLREENNKLKEEIKCSKYDFEIKMSKLETEIYKYQYKYQTENIIDIIDIIKQINQ